MVPSLSNAPGLPLAGTNFRLLWSWNGDAPRSRVAAGEETVTGKSGGPSQSWCPTMAPRALEFPEDGRAACGWRPISMRSPRRLNRRCAAGSEEDPPGCACAVVVARRRSHPAGRRSGRHCGSGECRVRERGDGLGDLGQGRAHPALRSADPARVNAATSPHGGRSQSPASSCDPHEFSRVGAQRLRNDSHRAPNIAELALSSSSWLATTP